MEASLALWVVFNACIVALLLVDLFFVHPQDKPVSPRLALVWTAVWIALSLGFAGGMWIFAGSDPALEFLTGYVIEKSLSLDNIFVFLLLFRYFQVPDRYQFRVLFWGVFGALVFRAILIVAGIAALNALHWLVYVLGALLIFTGIRLFRRRSAEVHPERNPVLRLFRRFVRVTDEYHQERFLIRRDGRLWATPLLSVLVIIEATDVMFALDSVPAILAITRDAFIVYSSNALALLGLRSLYFALAGIMDRFWLLHYALAAILIFVGTKMVLEDVVEIRTVVSLAVVLGTIGAALLLSWLRPRRGAHQRPRAA